MGATATGKSRLAISLAETFNGEIISMDSRQTYRGLDIGTGKVSQAERARVPHHLLDTLDVRETGSAGQHTAAAAAAIREIAKRGRLPILAGGTGLYFRALFGGLVAVTIPREEVEPIRATFKNRETRDLYEDLVRQDAARASVISPNDRVRITRALELIVFTGTPVSELYTRPTGRAPDVEYLKFFLSMPRAALRARIAERTQELFDAGWVEEVKGLLDDGVPADAPGMNSLGYREIATAIMGGGDGRDALSRVITLTQQYAKRQETFFRSEKDAILVDMTKAGMEREIHAQVMEFLRRPGLDNNLTQGG
jgi:tRNA dimethylallyltransferase